MTHAIAARTTLALLGLATAGFIVKQVVARPAGAVGRARRPAGAKRHRVVIVGAGFGGLQAALDLAHSPDLELCLIDQHNHHLFQPLLYQVATAVLEPDDIATPVRETLAPAPVRTVRLGTVTGVNSAAQFVECDGQAVPYDTLVLATGSEPSYFGHDEWQQAAPGLKTLEDAVALRGEILSAFERAAALPEGGAERAQALTFALIGGGATGVEMAGSVAELARDLLHHEFDDNPGMRARVTLIEGGTHLLSGFAPDLSQRATSDLSALGVELRLGARVTGIEPGRIHIGKETLAAGTVIWAAGVEATPVARWLGVTPGHGGRVPVRPDLSVAGHADIYVIGDAALATDAQGKPLPGLAPVAKQQGRYVARAIKRRLSGRVAAQPFRYRDYGVLATIGRNRAVAQFGHVHMTGFPAWLAWAGAHIFFLISFRNRVLVSTQWAISYITHRRSGRAIP